MAQKMIVEMGIRVVLDDVEAKGTKSRVLKGLSDESMDHHLRDGQGFFCTGSANRPLGANEEQRKQLNAYIGIG